MPQTVHIDSKRVTLDEKTKKIISVYNETINEFLQKNAKNAEYARMEKKEEAIFLDKIDILKCFIPKNEYIQLPELNEKLDAPAVEVRSYYRDYLYDLLKQINKGDKDTQSDKINSRFVLVCELLLRLATIGLSIDMNYEKDGDLLIEIMYSFSEKIVRHGLLEDQTFFMSATGRTPNLFINSFDIEHPKKLQAVTDVVKLIKLLRAPECAFTQTIDYLQATKFIAMRQIVAMLHPTQKMENLVDETLESTFANCSKKIDVIQSDDKIKNLHSILEETKWLFEVVQHLDLSQVAMGWVLLISGGLNAKVLAKLIKRHWENCLCLDLQPDDPILNTDVGKALRQLRATSRNNLRLPAFKVYKSLTELDDQNTRAKLLDCVRINLTTIEKLQRKLPEKLKQSLTEGEVLIQKLDSKQRNNFLLGVDESQSDQIDYTESTSSPPVFFKQAPTKSELEELPSIIFLRFLKKDVDAWKPEGSWKNPNVIPPGIEQFRNILKNIPQTSEEAEMILVSVLKILQIKRNGIEKIERDGIKIYRDHYERAELIFPNILQQLYSEQQNASLTA
jgi:hypothetical protein